MIGKLNRLGRPPTNFRMVLKSNRVIFAMMELSAVFRKAKLEFLNLLNRRALRVCPLIDPLLFTNLAECSLKVYLRKDSTVAITG